MFPYVWTVSLTAAEESGSQVLLQPGGGIQQSAHLSPVLNPLNHLHTCNLCSFLSILPTGKHPGDRRHPGIPGHELLKAHDEVSLSLETLGAHFTVRNFLSEHYLPSSSLIGVSSNGLF